MPGPKRGGRRRSSRRESTSAKEETTTRRRGRRKPTSEAAEEKPTGRRSRRGRSETKEETKKSKLSGWDAVIANKEANESRKAYRESMDATPRDFWLSGGEYAHVQILDDEPYAVDVHSVKSGGRWTKAVCQKNVYKKCLICSDGSKAYTAYAFKVLDLRGNWDKDKKEHKWDEPVVKTWLCSLTIATQLMDIAKKKGKSLTDMVLEVSKISGGKGAMNISIAYDDETERPIEVYTEEEYENTFEDPTHTYFEPLTDKALEAMGYELPED